MRARVMAATLGLWLVLATVARAHVNMITIDGSINPAVADFIADALTTSADEGAQALIIQIDTPGGLLSSTKTIVKDILGAPVPVIVYVAPSGASASSAGVFVTLAGHIAAMAPSTTIGAAHPVSAGGGNIGGAGSDMSAKVENFAVSFVQSIAERRGRNVQWAEDAVRKSVSITETEALRENVVDLVVPDLRALLGAVAGRVVQVGDREITLDLTENTPVVSLRMRLKQRILNVVADPNIAYLLFMAGLLGLYFELSSPGTIFPGVAGTICLLLALTAFQVLPINATGVLLMLLGIALLLGEVFMPSFGVLGVGGIVAFVLGSLLLFDTTDPGLVVNRSIIGAAALTVGGFMLVVGFLVLRAQWRPATTGVEGLIGEVGVVREWSDRSGHVVVHGEHWKAIGAGSHAVGERVEVVRVEPGMRLRVRPDSTRGPA